MGAYIILAGKEMNQLYTTNVKQFITACEFDRMRTFLLLQFRFKNSGQYHKDTSVPFFVSPCAGPKEYE